ncbi:LysR family transcriptional regulator [Motiliproteus coralliicola]|uniref:LysR family transcriptional regulator n=1 Tax=Motiliproteus coralliicola TaxID=2283196 RepID=A0A369WWV0_9GAMM|nr:LysR family transcriptional regulator [Motiliproteus coralliicola]RDE25016.1 LysR family transcriptional regulator [Motiliproteus coralliicola]
MISPILLRTFVELVDTQHFTRTAEQLHMTQPGVSQHIKKLEQQLGAALLARYGKSFELTEAGQRLYDYAQNQVEAETQLRESIVGDNPEAGALQLACSGAMALRLYPALLALQQRYPALQVNLEAAPNQAIIERIKANQTDLGIVSQPCSDPVMTQQRLGQDLLCLVLPASTVPDQSKPDWELLLRLGFINHPDGHHYASQLLEANFASHYVGMDSLPQSGYINQLSQILLPVSMGLGFTVLPQSAVAVFPYPEQLTIASLDQPVSESIYLLHKKHRPLPQRYQLITELLASEWQ